VHHAAQIVDRAVPSCGCRSYAARGAGGPIQAACDLPQREFAGKGGLASYDIDFSCQFRQAGVYLRRILKGANPTDLPVVQPTKFEIAINLKTARTLGLAIPESFLLRADVVIE
jgi:ABC-type uncharacterized transport system substrate-binding protein